ncbi:MAG: STAS domain-containing protein [Spirochaetes bacterium]|nr:STAS domain-containing protein [Spirochaetota bacterium]
MEKLITFHQHNGFYVIEVGIENIVFSVASKIMEFIKHRLIELNFPNIIINMPHIKKLDSSGIGFLITVQHLIESHNSRLIVVINSQSVLWVLNIAQADKYLNIHPNLDDALIEFR